MKEKLLKISLAERHILTGGFAKAAEAVFILLLVDSCTRADVSTNQDASRPTELWLGAVSTVDSALVFSSRAFPSEANKPAVAGVVEGSSVIDGRPSNRAALDKETTDSALNLRPLVLLSVAASQPASFVATFNKETLRKKAASIGKLLLTWKNPLSVFGTLKLKVLPVDTCFRKGLSLRS